MSVWKWPLLALQFLTVVPVRIREVSVRDLRASVVFFPALGMCLGALVWLVKWTAEFAFPPQVAAFLALSALTLVTGLLHLDGWMDVADALGSRKPKEQALTIMKDSRVGAFGASAGGLLLLGKYAALVALDPAHISLFVLPPLLSRLGMVWLMALAPSAHPESSLAVVYARQLPVPVVVVASLYSLAAVGLLLPWPRTLGAIVILTLAIAGYQRWMNRRFGGMTGDLYGAFNEGLEWVFFTWGAMK